MVVKKIYLICCLIILLITGCDAFLEDYQDETFSMNESDIVACNIFGADSISAGRTINGLLDTSLTSRADSIAFIMEDSLKVITTSENYPWQITMESDTCFMVLYLPSASLETKIYLDDPLNIDLYSDAGQVLEPESQSPSLTAIAGCPLIRALYTYNLSPGNYLIKVTGDDLNNTLFVLLGND